MAKCSNYVPRFKAALKYHGLPIPQEIIDKLGVRASSDRELDGIIMGVVQILEPPNCQKSHCPKHTTFGFCGCSEGLVPGKCPLNLEYLKRKRERRQSVKDAFIADIPETKLYGKVWADNEFERLMKDKFYGNLDKFKKFWAANKTKILKNLK